MPRLIEYVSFGICSGYGDADYRVSSAIADLSPETMRELRVAATGAIALMEETWKRGQAAKMPPGQQAKSAPSEG